MINHAKIINDAWKPFRHRYAHLLLHSSATNMAVLYHTISSINKSVGCEIFIINLKVNLIEKKSENMKFIFALLTFASSRTRYPVITYHTECCQQIKVRLWWSTGMVLRFDRNWVTGVSARNRRISSGWIGKNRNPTKKPELPGCPSMIIKLDEFNPMKFSRYSNLAIVPWSRTARFSNMWTINGVQRPLVVRLFQI